LSFISHLSLFPPLRTLAHHPLFLEKNPGRKKKKTMIQGIFLNTYFVRKENL
jgi:hypothetical protein